MKKLVLKINGSIWLKPAIYCLISLLIAILVVYIDMNLEDFIDKHIPTYFVTSVDLAQIILGTISAAIVTMTTITFSTIMVVLTTYTSQFSPRILKGFVTKSSTMRVLGVFLGGFIYSILSLLFMRKAEIDNDVIAATVGVFVAFVCLAFFAYFIQNVATSIQVSNLIKELTIDALKSIEREKDALTKFRNKTVEEELSPPQGYSKVKEITGNSYGYVQLIDYPSLFSYAKEKNFVIEVNQYIGHYVTNKSKLLTIYYNDLDQDLDLKVSDYVTIGDERTSIQDIEFCMIKMVEIALRAISPGINDPNTAIDCIRFLRTPLLEALRNGGRYLVFYDEEDKRRLVKKKESTEQLLYTTFYQISHYGRQDISILLALLDTLIEVAENSSHKIKIEVKTFADYVIKKFDQEVLEELDRKKLTSKLEDLEMILGN
ncbi:DUF2254 domain-containing protein [Anaerobacillus isosaccharinicus]|uniref:DUF2254 domain-containing protein n=2 Tax=Anaerobacillus isosaccharinicus TaxID=1532552 RepID=A0A1S2M322_9BACI|nr:DUF2254 domain-containing protein [Anaerobacillus isosaccharinicus]